MLINSSPVTVWLNISFGTLKVVSQTTFPTDHLNGTKTQSAQRIARLVLEQQIEVQTQKSKQQ